MKRCSRMYPGSAGWIFLLVGVFLLTRGAHIVGAIVLAIGIGKLVRRLQWPTSGLPGRIAADAQFHGVRVPADFQIRSDLEAIYSMRASSNVSLAVEYDDLIQSMWIELKQATTYGQWRRVLHQIRNGLNDEVRATNVVADSLARFKRANAQWRAAQREAGGTSTFY
jgi:hypothetical protein